MLTQSVTARFGSGFGPAGLQLCGSATLAGTRLRLTDGGPNQMGAAFATARVDVSRAFTTTFEFRLTPHEADQLGLGITFVLQNDQPDSPGNLTDSLGLPMHPHVAVKLGTCNIDWMGWSIPTDSDNSTDLYLGILTPGMPDSGQIDVPKASVDLHSGHVIRCALDYDPAAHTLAETLTDLTTLGTWTHTYSAVNMQSVFARVDVTGRYAFAGFTGSTGAAANTGTGGTGYGRGQSTQEITRWTWADGTTPAPLSYTAAVTLATPGGSAGAVFGADGLLVRTLWQAGTLPAGTFPVAWDGLDNHGLAPSDPGPYTVKVVTAAETYANHVIGNDTLTPSDPRSCYPPLGLYGVAVKADGSAFYLAGNAQDTVGGLGFKVANASGYIDGPLSGAYGVGGTFTGRAVCCDSRYVYVAVLDEQTDGVTHIGCANVVLRLDTQTPGPAFGGFTVRAASADGSDVLVYSYGFTALRIIPAGLLPRVERYSLSAIAVSNPADPATGTLWVADVLNDRVLRYDKVTGAQVGTPIAVPHPTGLAVDAAGNGWVSHGLPATSVSVYSPAGVLLRDATELLGLVDVRGLAIGPNYVIVADKGAGTVLRYLISGTGVSNGNAPEVYGGPASVGNDDGRTKFWDLRSVALAADGNLYCTQVTPGNASTNLGSQLIWFNGDQTAGWVRGGYEYQSCAGGYSQADPTTVLSSTLKHYHTNTNNGTWEYKGFAGHPGYATNTWSKLVTFAPCAPPKWVHVGTKDFFVLIFKEDGGVCRALFFTLDVNGASHAAAIVGTVSPLTGHNYAWHDAVGDGIPLDGQVVDGGAALPDNLHADAAGNLWYTLGDPAVLWKIPLGALDANGNPTYSWASAAVVTTLAIPPKAFVVGEEGIYVIANDPGIGPQTTLSASGNYSWGGGNALAKYSLAGVPQWTIPLAQYAQSLDAVPVSAGWGITGGVVVGSELSADLAYVTGDGQYTSIHRSLVSDNLDYPGGTIRVCRSPDSTLDVFCEGLASSYGAWYRVADQNARTVVTAALAHATPPPAAGTTQFDTRGGYGFPCGVFADAAFL